ncbi:MAG: hypothetical protein Q8J74_12020 [Candidatus Didemnitutus sp.]|nr:hypothetical protein [Candidatus Didemnitutus sp.]
MGENLFIRFSSSIHVFVGKAGMIQGLLWLSCILALTFGRAAAVERALLFDLPQSRVEISAKATWGTFLSRLRVFEPLVTVDEGGRVVAAELHFRFADIVTGKPKRDRALQEWQQSDVFSDSHFVLTRWGPPRRAIWRRAAC